MRCSASSSAPAGAAWWTAADAATIAASTVRGALPDAPLPRARGLRVTTHPSGSTVGRCATEEESVGCLGDVVEMSTAAIAVLVLDAGHRRGAEVSGCIPSRGTAEDQPPPGGGAEH